MAVLNDKDGELINFYRVIAHHKDEFVRQFSGLLYSREIYNHLKQIKNIEGLTDIQRAANFYARLRMSFAKRVDAGQHYGYVASNRKHSMFNFSEFDAAAEKLKQAFIENDDWLSVAKRYDRPHTLFFADPPYLDAQGYAVNFEIEQYQKLADFMRTCKGKVILTINAHPEIAEIFADFEKIEVPIKYTISCLKDAEKESKERIFLNFKP